MIDTSAGGRVRIKKLIVVNDKTILVFIYKLNITYLVLNKITDSLMHASTLESHHF